jgi:calcineurin-like phosphoesterase family protein
VFCNRNFVTSDYTKSKEEIEKIYLSHILHISNIVGMENVILSTDDMGFMGDIDPEYYDTIMFDYSNIYNCIRKLLIPLNKDADKIMYQNAYDKIIDKLIYINKQKCK